MTGMTLTAQRMNERVRAEVARTPHPYTTDVDLSSEAFLAGNPQHRYAQLARLRREAPISFHPPVEVAIDHQQQGFWALVKADHVAEATKRDDLFLSGFGNRPDAIPFAAWPFFLGQDGELHRRNRALVSSAFTPKRIAAMIEGINQAAKQIVDDLIGAGEIDFVDACSARLPSLTGAIMVGIPDSEREEFTYWSNIITGRMDPELSDLDDPTRRVLAGIDYLQELGKSLATHRRAHPADDLITALVQAEIDGVRLTDDDMGGFLFIMSVGANDTTKNSTSLSMLALDQHPDQLAWLLEDLDGRIGVATDEFLRWASPVYALSRVAAEDVDFHGNLITKGDKISMFYGSANRDEDRFVNPNSFDLSRSPNPHSTFGGGGVHYCLGNRLAVTNLRAIFRELLKRTKVTVTGEPEYLRSANFNGIKHLPVNVA